MLPEYLIRIPVLLFLYLVEFVVSVCTFRFLSIYLWDRFRRGAASLFMISIFTFSFFFGMQNLAAIGIYFIRVFPEEMQNFYLFSLFLWTLSHIGTTLSFGLIGVLVMKKRFDLYVSRLEPKKKE